MIVRQELIEDDPYLNRWGRDLPPIRRRRRRTWWKFWRAKAPFAPEASAKVSAIISLGTGRRELVESVPPSTGRAVGMAPDNGTLWGERR